MEKIEKGSKLCTVSLSISGAMSFNLVHRKLLLQLNYRTRCYLCLLGLAQHGNCQFTPQMFPMLEKNKCGLLHVKRWGEICFSISFLYVYAKNTHLI